MEQPKVRIKDKQRSSKLVAQGRKAGDRGQSLLEFALLLPFLALLGIGVVDIGRAIYYTIAVNNAAAAGVEYGSRDAVTASDNIGMEKSAVCDANGGFGNVCRSGILTLANTTAAHGCTCDNSGGTSAEACTSPINSGDCDTLTCGTGELVECVQVTTTATVTPIFHYPGLPASYTANGSAVMRVRK
jgi:Flp pilus assembly protein TadG